MGPHQHMEHLSEIIVMKNPECSYSLPWQVWQVRSNPPGEKESYSFRQRCQRYVSQGYAASLHVSWLFFSHKEVNLARERGRDRNSPACALRSPSSIKKKKKEFWIITSFWLIFLHHMHCYFFASTSKKRTDSRKRFWSGYKLPVSFCTHPQCHSHCIGGAGKREGKTILLRWWGAKGKRKSEQEFRVGLPWWPNG